MSRNSHVTRKWSLVMSCDSQLSCELTHNSVNSYLSCELTHNELTHNSCHMSLTTLVSQLGVTRNSVVRPLSCDSQLMSRNSHVTHKSSHVMSCDSQLSCESVVRLMWVVLWQLSCETHVTHVTLVVSQQHNSHESHNWVVTTQLTWVVPTQLTWVSQLSCESVVRLMWVVRWLTTHVTWVSQLSCHN